MNAMAKKILSVIGALMTAAAVLLAVLLVGIRVVGFTPLAVLSGSMEPNFPVGSVVYVRAVDVESITEGDVITFELGGGTLATHRVVSIDPEHREFVTKGDANAAEDSSPVSFDSVKGKVYFCIPLVGYISEFLTLTYGKIAACFFVILIVLLLLIPDIFKNEEQKKQRS